MMRETDGRPGRVPGFAGLRRARSARRDRRCAADAAGAAWQGETGNNPSVWLDARQLPLASKGSRSAPSVCGGEQMGRVARFFREEGAGQAGGKDGGGEFYKVRKDSL